MTTSDSLPPHTQAPPPPPEPELNNCINNIIAEVKHPNSSSTRGQANLHFAMVGLSMMIAREQDGHRPSNEVDSLTTFPITQTPAMRELITNPQLFQVILSMLSSNTLVGVSGHQTDCSLDINKQGRKRSPSEELAAHARKKQMLTCRQTSQSQLPGTSTSISTGLPDSASNHRVFAATVLYSVLQHMDHWPIELMKVFAEDAFGPRTWVDNEICRDLVSNLQMSLNPVVIGEPIDAATSLIADEVESYFSSLISRIEKNESSPMSLPTRRVIISSQQRMPSAKEVQMQSRQTEAMDDSASSSSGEEEVLESDIREVCPIIPQYQDVESLGMLNKLFRRSPSSNLRIRSRYVGHNLELAHEAISDALTDRLSSKSKQNSRLLQALPGFLCIPRVRCLSSRHLEKWLQSPALAGLARNLLSRIARNMANEDPPLPDDVEVIDNVLKMKLKANQFSMHVENIALIATRMPTQAVAKQVFMFCLTGEKTNEGNVVLDPSPDHLEILRSVYTVLDSDLAAQSLASAILAVTSHSTQSHSRSMRLVVNALGDRYDGFTFTESIIKSQTGLSTNVRNVNQIAWFIFECAMLVGLRNGLEDELVSKMLTLRKAILHWCVTELGGIYYNRICKEERSRCNNSYDGTGVVTTAPGGAGFDSYFDRNPRHECDQDYSTHEFMKKVRSLLFLNPATSNELAVFSDHKFDNEESECIDFCCRYSYAVDDEMLNIVLESPYITPSTAIAIIENLVLGCSSAQENIAISSGVIWKVYKLSEYVPQLRSNVCKEDLKLPRLAHPSLWWRVTAIALVVCSLSSHVGIAMWKEHPTLRALIKMTTSQKYRFPTVDCDEAQKEVVRLEEAKAREKEAKIAELLFASPKPSITHDPKPTAHRPPEYRQGLRTSARQKEKKDRLVALEQERKASAIHAEQMKLRRQLKILQRSIMIWEPVQCPRKPPKESIEMLLSIDETFNLADKFRSSIEPDFLLQTIGDGRSAIERAYDWLIPIISLHPEIIHRLQPSATCFLLLRAYEAEAGKSNRELIGLSAPLLSHVRKCLSGDFGERHSLLALELLLTDIADESADRRRCSRKVLQQSIPNTFGLCGWMRQLKFAANAKSVIPLTIAYVCRALAYERGKVLSVLIIYLHEYKIFLIENELEDSKFSFIGSLCALISTRPHVVSDAMDSDDRLRKLVLSEITTAFDEAMISSSDSNDNCVESSLVSITLPIKDHSQATKSIVVSSCLIRAAVVVVSNWQDTGKYQCNTNIIGEVMGPEVLFQRLLEYLVIPVSSSSACKTVDTKSVSGLASAVYKHSNMRASTVEDWVSLAKAKDGIVAKHAALSAPDVFLPRLLLCCGISQLSFSTMLNRLNEIGRSSPEPKTFGELLSPTAISAWGLPRIGTRRILKRRLLGRILAYMRISRNDPFSNDDEKSLDKRHAPFVSWLFTECKSWDEPKKTHAESSSCRENITAFATGDINAEVEFASLDTGDFDAPSWSTDRSIEVTAEISLCRTEFISENFIRSCIFNERHILLEESLELKERSFITNSQYDDGSTAKILLEMYSIFKDEGRFVRILLKWVPRLLQIGRGNDTWHIIFVDVLEKSKYSLKFETCVALVSSCAMQWPHEYILECQRWVVSQQARCCPWNSHLSLKLVLRFLVLSSEQKSVHVFDYNRTPPCRFHYVQSPDCAKCIVDLSLTCLSLDDQKSTNREVCTINARNVLPDGLVLILIVAKAGKEYLDLTTELILNRIDESPRVFSSLLLRLYTLFPSLTNLSKNRLRTSLLQGAKEHMASWMQLRCPLDSQIRAMISYLSKSPHKPLLQSIIQIASQHPLLLMRHLNDIWRGLIDDGSGLDSHGQPLIKRGRIQGNIPEVFAEIDGRTIKVMIVQWGYSFSEPVWSSMLDLLLSIPSEVLFRVGVDSGLHEIMDVYSRLFVVHTCELKSETNIIQLRGKFTRLLSLFESYNTAQHEDAIKD
ncbi:hypothetical protein ACHAW6_015042 [Cyclotella cf. meneghiniana]